MLKDNKQQLDCFSITLGMFHGIYTQYSDGYYTFYNLNTFYKIMKNSAILHTVCYSKQTSYIQ